MSAIFSVIYLRRRLERYKRMIICACAPTFETKVKVNKTMKDFTIPDERALAGIG